MDDKYYLSDKMTRYVLGNENSTFNSRDAVVNPRIAHTIGAKSVGGLQRVQWENYIVSNLPFDTPAKVVKKLIFEERGWM